VQIIRAGEIIYSASTESLSQGHESSVRIALRKPVEIDDLSCLAGVDHVETLDTGRFRLFFSADANPDALIAAAAQQQWGLYELIPEQQSLEDLFIELTQTEESTAK
jgi:ABC-2 type transport system ATP-binding protein